MILAKKPMTMAEVQDLIKNAEEKKPVHDYLKLYVKLKKESVLKLAEEIRALNNPKIREEDIVKIVDFMPRLAEELNVILRETTLNEEETNAILEIVKKY